MGRVEVETKEMAEEEEDREAWKALKEEEEEEEVWFLVLVRR